VGVLLPWMGFAFGALAALIARQPRENVTAIAIETGIQNSGIAIMLLKLSFDAPDGDMASVIPVVVSIFTPGPLLLVFGVLSAQKFIERRRAGEKLKSAVLENGNGVYSQTTEENADGELALKNSRSNASSLNTEASGRTDSGEPLLNNKA